MYIDVCVYLYNYLDVFFPLIYIYIFFFSVFNFLKEKAKMKCWNAETAKMFYSEGQTETASEIKLAITIICSWMWCNGKSKDAFVIECLNVTWWYELVWYLQLKVGLICILWLQTGRHIKSYFSFSDYNFIYVCGSFLHLWYRIW